MIDARRRLSRLLARCPSLQIIVTSRELLKVEGEADYAVPALTDDEAVALFTERSGVAPDTVVAELSRRLDNLPLAIELAAADAVMSVARSLSAWASAWTSQGWTRQRRASANLRATIAWSHDLLADHEKALFARLSVFADGCTLEAAEEVADADLDALQSLLEKSLVRRSVTASGCSR